MRFLVAVRAPCWCPARVARAYDARLRRRTGADHRCGARERRIAGDRWNRWTCENGEESASWPKMAADLWGKAAGGPLEDCEAGGTRDGVRPRAAAGNPSGAAESQAPRKTSETTGGMGRARSRSVAGRSQHALARGFVGGIRDSRSPADPRRIKPPMIE